MLEFPIDEIYRRVAKFDVTDDDKGTTIGSGAGFFYWYNDEIFFATNRNYIATEEKAFLPDSIILYLNTESGNSHGSTITLPLYDKTEKPVWRVLTRDSEQIFVSIPIRKALYNLDYTHYFFAELRLPSVVSLPIDDIILNIPVPVGVSLAAYFYSNPQNGKTLQNEIEDRGDFRINRRGFATDMVEMVLVLLQHNLNRLKEAKEKKGGSSEKRNEESLTYLAIHDNLIYELEKIMIQFSDVLEPSIFERIQKIFTILKDGNMEDYFVARHLIHKVLMLLGENILFTQ